MKKFCFCLILCLMPLMLLPAIDNKIDAINKPLPIPPLIEGRRIGLEMREGELELPFGTSKTFGFNGDYLGPTIRVRNGDLTDINILNSLNEPTTVHWHGLHVPAEFDGGPHQVIGEGKTWSPSITIRQNAATLWYHPHLMGRTAEHVYRGLAGMFIIDDDYSDSLDIPSRYGENDFPLILQDRAISKKGSFVYQPTRADIMHGYIGNAILVNGAYQPELKISQGTYRFRILNGSNSSIYRISFSDAHSFTVIASDGGFLPETVSADKLIISPGERYEVLIDFKKEADTNLILEIMGGDSHEALSIAVNNKKGEFFSHPDKLRYEHPNYNKEDLERRTFNMETRGMGAFTINGQQMDMDVINFNLKKDTEEIWTVRNIGMGMMNIPHSFHVHDTQFTVLSVNGSQPPPLYRGPKDTILMMAGDEVIIGVSFRDYTGIYMYHCHLLEHEDAGMMGQFLIQ